jgi:peptidoglycan/LPS O-acetylase OafA/YrhL
MTYRPDIDGLRAVAIILVVAFHIQLPGFKAGFIGVDVFFVISGFLITALLLKELEATGKLSLSQFYARRIRRLAPAIVFVTISVMLLGLFLLHPFGQQQELFKAALASLFFVANIYFSNTTGGYFDTPDSEVYLLHYWSLSVEEQFYIFWPLSLLLLSSMAMALKLRLRHVVLGGTLLLALGTLAYSLHLTKMSMNSAYFLMPSRAWQLLFGSLTAIVFLARGETRGGRAYTNLLYAMGISLLILALLIIDGPGDYPGWQALLPTLSAVCFIRAGSLTSDHFARNILSIRPIVFIGKLSFSWYLWHWPLIAMGRSYFLGVDNLYRNLGVAVFSLFLALVTYTFIEEKVRTVRISSGGDSRRVIMVGAAAFVGSVFLAGMLGLFARHADELQPWWEIDARLEEARFSRPLFRAKCHYDGVFTGFGIQRECITGDPNGGIRAVLWGDSHADHLSPLIDHAGKEQGYGVLQRSFSACRPLLGLYSYLDEEQGKQCRAFQHAVMAEIAVLKDSGLEGVILSGYWWGEFEAIHNSKDGYWPFEKALSDTVAYINSLGLRVLIVSPTPDFRFNVGGCLARQSGEHCRMSRKVWDAKSSAIRDIINEISRDRDDVGSLDLTDFFCDKDFCYSERSDLILFRDKNHITPKAALAMLPLAREQLAWITGKYH